MIITNMKIGLFSAGVFVAISFLAFLSLQQVHAEETEKPPEIETESGSSTESGGGTSESGGGGGSQGKVESHWKVEEAEPMTDSDVGKENFKVKKGEIVKRPYDSAGDDRLMPHQKIKTETFGNQAIPKGNTWKNHSSKPVAMEESELGNASKRRLKDRKVRHRFNRKQHQGGVSRKGKSRNTHTGR